MKIIFKSVALLHCTFYERNTLSDLGQILSFKTVESSDNNLQVNEPIIGDLILPNRSRVQTIAGKKFNHRR